VTFLEVLDDAVKIGLGGFIGWLIARGARSHEFEKGRRRRKQDCLDRVIEDLDEQESAFTEWCVSSLAYLTQKKKGNPDMELATMKDRIEDHKKHEVAATKLNRSRSKLIVFGFDECAASLRDYQEKLREFMVVVNGVLNNKKELEDYPSGRPEVTKCADNVRAAVTKAFATL
jgi:hypothetical protein